MTTRTFRPEELQSADSLTTALLGALDTHDRVARKDAIADAAMLADTSALVGAIADQDNSVRRNAAMAAMAGAGVRSVPALAAALRHEDPEVVLFAANVLGQTRDRSAISLLIPLVEHPALNVAQAAIESLAMLRASVAVDVLVRALDRDPWLQLAALEALGAIGDPRAVAAIAPLIDDEGVCGLALEALGRIGTPEALGHLAATIRREIDDTTFVDCVKAIGELLERHPDERALESVAEWEALRSVTATDVHHRMAKLLGGSPTSNGVEPGDEREVRRAAASIVRALKIRPLYRLLVTASADPELRERLRFCLVAIGQDVTPYLMGGFSSDNPNVREFVCDCVSALGFRSAGPTLIQLTRDPVSSVRCAAARALPRVQFLAGIPALLDCLADEDVTVAKAAAEALALFDAELVTREVVSRPPTGVARERWLEAATRSPHPGQRALLDAALSDASALVRAAALRAIEVQATSEEQAELARTMLDDPSPLVRSVVVGMLGRTRASGAAALLLEHYERDALTRESVVNALAALGDITALPRLVALVNEPRRSLRFAVIRAIHKLDRTVAEATLVPMLRHADVGTRELVIRTLASPDPSPTLTRYLLAAARDAEPDVRVAVAETLPVRPETAGIFDELAVDPSPRVREAARQRRHVDAPELWNDRATAAPVRVPIALEYDVPADVLLAAKP